MTLPAPYKILLATGNTRDRKALSASLTDAQLPFEIDHAESGPTALENLSNHYYDCAVIDTNLPGGSGVGVLRQLRDQGVATPVIMISKTHGDKTVAEMLRVGAEDCLTQDEAAAGQLVRSLWQAVRLYRAERNSVDAQIKLSHQSLYDDLTGLANRALFLDRLEQAIAVAKRDDRQVALLIMDLNRFRDINRTLSHAAGDQLLQAVAARLREGRRESDTLARLGGDEFAQLQPTGATLAGAINAAQRIIETLATPIAVHGHNLAIGISIGIALFPTHGTDSATLLRRADIAMYAAKRDNRGYAVYAGEDDPKSLLQLSLAADLRRAVEDDEMILHYQPKVVMGGSRLCGVESLVRWQHPELGIIAPDVFIPLAEQSGVIEPLTRWVLDHALKQQREWREQGYRIPVSVNLCPTTLHDTSFPDTVATLLERWAAPSHALSLEITETAIMSDVARATETASRLNGMGVHISIDDFGTGYTSFAYIRKLPINEIKVDKSFVLNMSTVPDDEVIVRSIVTLGLNLGIDVVAEGVEDDATWDLLAALDCTQAQGYFISPPVAAENLRAWLANSPWAGGVKGAAA